MASKCKSLPTLKYYSTSIWYSSKTSY